MTSKGQTVGTVTKTVGYGFTNGNLTLITTPSGQSVGYGYNSNHQVTSVSVNGATVLSSALYDPFGPVRGWTWGNGTLAVRTYDTDGFLRQVDSAGLSTYTPLDDLSIGTRTDDVPMPVGIPTGTTNYTPSPTSNRLVSSTGVQGRSYIYDNAGNTTTSGSLTFNYNYRGRMSFTSGAATSYLYNALGQRVKKSNASLTRLFMYDEAGHLLGEYDATGALVEETVWLGDIPVATIRPGTPVGIYYVHTDHLNTPRRVSRPSDNRILWRWDSDPFGQAAANEDADGDSQVFSYNLRFPGQYFDSESGLSQNYFRDYDPATGRYVESDPIGLGGGTNTYAYAGSDPIWSSDPSGLLLRGSGWSDPEWNYIEKAEAKIRNELKKCSCSNGGSCIPCDLAQTLVNRLDTIIVSYAPLGGDCGWTPPTTPPRGFYLSKAALLNAKKCRPGCLASTIYHELLHTTGVVFDEATTDEPPAAVLEGKCIGNLCRKSSP